MRISVTQAVRLLPLLAVLPLLQGCDQKEQKTQTQALAPPIVDAPPPKPATVSPADLPPPVVGPAQTNQPSTTTAANQPAEQPKKPVHKPKKTAPAAPAQPAQETTASNTNPTVPAAPPSSSVSAIGELSSGASGDVRSQAEEGINSTEKGLNAVTRPLSEPESKTAAQIREFLKQARAALTTGDVDGAVTLTKKAKVLLAELNQ